VLSHHHSLPRCIDGKISKARQLLSVWQIHGTRPLRHQERKIQHFNAIRETRDAVLCSVHDPPQAQLQIQAGLQDGTPRVVRGDVKLSKTNESAASGSDLVHGRSVSRVPIRQRDERLRHCADQSDGHVAAGRDLQSHLPQLQRRRPALAVCVWTRVGREMNKN
jgi:hypothetical protein